MLHGTDVATFAVVLRRRRIEADLTQEELAERAGISARSVRSLETGQVRTPRPETVRLLAEALGLGGDALARFRVVAREEHWRDAPAPSGDTAGGPGAARPGPAAAGPPPHHPAAAPAVSAGRPAPAQLPLDVHGFAGRERELDTLHRLLGGPAGAGLGTVVGTAGVGKTALAVRWAHQAAASFPDGQLYVDLRGYGTEAPLTPSDVLASFLRALGLRGDDIPSGAAERAARYRTEVAGRRMLILLDNARSVGQVRPVLPGSSSCSVLVTSRDSLAGLVVREGARRIELDQPPLPDALAMLSELIGPRIDREPYPAVRLAQLCACLPLALRVAAEWVATRPEPLAALLAELGTDPLERLDAVGDPCCGVRAAFSWSYRWLPPGAAQLFRAVGLHPGQDWDLHAAAALTGDPPGRVRALLDLLVREHLVRQVGLGRYTMHGLMRGYVHWLARSEPDGIPASTVLSRLADYYLHTAIAARHLLRLDAGRPLPTHRHEPSVRLPNLSSGPAAVAWLEAECANLAVLSALAAEQGQLDLAADLAAARFS